MLAFTIGFRPHVPAHPETAASRGPRALLVSLALLVGQFATVALAQSTTYTWDGGAGTLNWADAANWSGDALPVPVVSANVPPMNTILFDGSVPAGATVSMQGVTNFSGGSTNNRATLTFQNGAGFTLGSLTGLNYFSAINVSDAHTYSINGGGGANLAWSTSFQTDSDLNVATGGVLEISGGFTVSGFGSRTVNKKGAGELRLSGGRPAGASTVSMSLQAGTLSVASVADLGTGALTLAGGNLRYTGSGTEVAPVVSLANPRVIDITEATGDLTLVGGALGSGARITKEGPGRLELSVGSGSSNFAANQPVLVSDGTLALNAAAEGVIVKFQSTVTGSAGTTIQVKGPGTVRNDSLTANWSTNQATLDVDTGGTFDIRGNKVNVAALTGGGSVINSYYTADSGIRGETIAVGVDNGSGEFSGVISGNGTTTAQPGRISLVKIGSGTQVLSGANTYTGPTTVLGGRLAVDGSLGNTAVSVESGAVLGGSGTIAGSVSVEGGGRLAPGNSIESLQVGSTTFASGGIYDYEVDSSAALAVGADLLVVAGNLDLTGSILSFTDIASTPGMFGAGTTFAMINYTGSLTGMFTFGGETLADGGLFTVGGQQWIIDYDYSYDTAAPTTAQPLNFVADHLPAGGTQTFVAITAVPEPSALALGGVAAVALACGYRVRRRATSGRYRRRRPPPGDLARGS